MRGIQVRQYVNGPHDLQVIDVLEPQPKADEYLIEVHACGGNFFDLLQIRGKYQWVGKPTPNPQDLPHMCSPYRLETTLPRPEN